MNQVRSLETADTAAKRRKTVDHRWIRWIPICFFEKAIWIIGNHWKQLQPLQGTSWKQLNHLNPYELYWNGWATDTLFACGFSIGGGRLPQASTPHKIVSRTVLHWGICRKRRASHVEDMNAGHIGHWPCGCVTILGEGQSRWLFHGGRTLRTGVHPLQESYGCTACRGPHVVFVRAFAFVKSMECSPHIMKNNENHCRPSDNQRKPLQNHWKISEINCKNIETHSKQLQNMGQLSENNRKAIEKAIRIIANHWTVIANHSRAIENLFQPTIASDWKIGTNHCNTFEKAVKTIPTIEKGWKPLQDHWNIHDSHWKPLINQWRPLQDQR